MRRTRIFPASLLTLLCACLAPAAESQTVKPLDLYVRGDYEAAAAAGEKEGSGESLAVAARAVLAEANLREKPCLDCLNRAEDLAQRAIAADPKRTEAYVYYAVALGYEARIIGMLRARFANYPLKAKRALDAARMLSPGDPWTLAALGGWNIEVVRNGGSFLGNFLYGASFSAGVDFFRRGIAADPENLVLHFQYALSLSGYDLDGNRSEVESALKSAAGLRPRTAYETQMKARAAMLLELLSQDRRADFLRLIRQYQGYPTATPR